MSNRLRIAPDNSTLAQVDYSSGVIWLRPNSFYFSAEKKGVLDKLVCGILSHENLHLALRTESKEAFDDLDNISPPFRLKYVDFHIDGLGLDAPNSQFSGQ